MKEIHENIWLETKEGKVIKEPKWVKTEEDLKRFAEDYIHLDIRLATVI